VALETKNFAVGECVVCWVAIDITGVPTTPTYFALVIPHDMTVAAAFGMLVRTMCTFTFSLHQFPGIFDYVLWKAHHTPPQGNIEVSGNSPIITRSHKMSIGILFAIPA
jgi:hypothetical protein